MNPRSRCEFFLLRYVPDIVRGEFVNIGVLLRETSNPRTHSPEPLLPPRTEVRFTSDWRRVLSIDPSADTYLLESFKQEVAALLVAEAAGPKPEVSLVSLFRDTLSNAIQMTEPRATLAESFPLELEHLMRLYISS